jgi:hypothetical protein
LDGAGWLLHLVDRSIRKDRRLVGKICLQVVHPEAHKIMRTGEDGGCAAMIKIVKASAKRMGMSHSARTHSKMQHPE